MTHKPFDSVDATNLFCEQSYSDGTGPINRMKVKKLFNQSFTNETNNELVSHLFENNNFEMGLYRLENGEYWVFEVDGVSTKRYKLTFLGESIEDVFNLLFGFS